MIYFKSCVRCGGDVKKDRDSYGEYVACFQCGWSRDLSADPLSRLAKIMQSEGGAASVKQAG